MVCLPDAGSAATVARETEVAIRLFRESPPDERFVTDEILVHIHGANAHLQHRNLDAAAHLLGTVFALPTDQRVSWHRQRLTALMPLLTHTTIRDSPAVVELQAKIAAF